MKPNKKNFCGGNFADWLEINLTDACNGKCKWCIEKHGWHPTKVASWKEIARAADASGKKNILLLGGEPTLYPALAKLIKRLTIQGKKVFLTTNGSRLGDVYVEDNLSLLAGLNVSIHSYELQHNEAITGVHLDEKILLTAMWELTRRFKIPVRFNCNLIKGAIDTVERIEAYIKWAKMMMVEKVRFAELTYADDQFVDLTELYGSKFGINKNPFVKGCNINTVIDGMPVTFKQACGLYTKHRPKVECTATFAPKQVLYYDGKIYNGWQTKQGLEMHIQEILKAVKANKLTVTEAEQQIKKAMAQTIMDSPAPQSSGGCSGSGCSHTRPSGRGC